MTKKRYVQGSIVVLLLGSFLLFTRMMTPDRIEVNGIQSFHPTNTSTEESYLLFYPADFRTSQEATLVKEVNAIGETLEEYIIHDEDFGRLVTHQKPTQPDNVYLSFLGTSDPFYFIYDVANNRFKKMDVVALPHDVGIDHMKHYGEDIIIQTNASHKTGTQNMDEDGRFSVSISNVTSAHSFETEPGFSPKWSPILANKKQTIFGTNGHHIDDTYQPPQIAIKDHVTNDILYLTFSDTEEELYPLFQKEDIAYIASSSGHMYTINEAFETQTFTPFESLDLQERYVDEDLNSFLMLDDSNALFSVYDQTRTTFGILNFEDEPRFTALDERFTEDEHHYRILYQDKEEQEIYLVEYGEKTDHVIVLDRETFRVKQKFPIEQGYLMDFVVKLGG